MVAMAGDDNAERASGDSRRGPRVGWGDLPGELHREILRLVPLRDATAARQVSREMRDEVDEVWRAWRIRATAKDRREDIRGQCRSRLRNGVLYAAPLVVYAHDGSHAHHLASLGLWWLALLAEAPGIHGMSWTVRDVRDVDQSPLMVAVQARRPVGRGADGRVECAYALGDKEVARVVRAAVGLGADVNRRLQGAWPLMTYCAMRGCLEAVKACLAAGAQVDAGSGNDDGGWWTALVHAGQGAHEAVVEALLEAGASAKVGPDGRDETLVPLCLGQPTPAIVRRLVEAGSDVNAVKRNGCSAIHAAARADNLAVMETLVGLGADVTATSVVGSTAMHDAATGEVVRWLVAHGLSIEGDGVNDSPLQSACADGHVDAVRALIELGADVHYRDWGGDTALHCAVQGDQEEAAVEVTQLLLAAGADASAADDDGEMPLHMVKHAACVDLLLDAGADLEVRDEEGVTPIGAVASNLLRTAEVVVLYTAETVLRMADRGADLVNTGEEPGLLERVVAELRAAFSDDESE